MKIEDFTERMGLYTLRTKMLLYYNNVTYRVEIDRTLNEMISKDVDIYMNPVMMCTSQKVFEDFRNPFTFKNDIINMVSEKYEGRYYQEVDSNLIFCDETIPRTQTDKFTDWLSFEMEYRFEDYLKMVSSMKRNKKNLYVMKFMPTVDELNMIKKMDNKEIIFEFPHFTMTEANFDIVMHNTLEMRNALNDFYSISFLSKKIWVNTEGFKDMNSLRSALSTWDDTSFDYKKMQIWRMTRHNMFGEQVCNVMSWPLPNNGFDVNMMKSFDYYGEDSYLTPDYMVEIKNVLYLIDFKVTEGDPGKVREDSIKKYYTLSRGLSRHLKREVRSEAIVWKINSMFNIQMFEEINFARQEIMSNEVIKTLRGMHVEMTRWDSYEKLKNQTEDQDDEAGDFINKIYLYENLIKNMVNSSKINNKKTIDVGFSRETSNDEMKEWKNQSIYKDVMKSTNIDSKEYKNQLFKTMSRMITNKDLPNYLNEVLEFDKMKIKNLIEDEMEKATNIRVNLRNNLNFKKPKIFKLPLMNFFSENFADMMLPKIPPWFKFLRTFEDGTGLLGWRNEVELLEDKKTKYNEKGLGIDEEEDVDLITDLLEYLMSENEYYSKEKDEDYKEFHNITSVNEMMKTNVWGILRFWQNLMENLCYLDGRRHIINKRSGHTAFKKFEKYAMLVRKGSMLTSEKQLRFKLIAHKDDVVGMMNDNFHAWKEYSGDLLQTKWLTISITDIQHFVKIAEVTIGIISDSKDKFDENRINKGEKFSPVSKMFYTTILMLMEHRRGTSTTNQLNRYLMHSALAYITNRTKLIKDILKDPIRSILESYVRICQYRWYEKVLENVEELWTHRISTMMSTDTDYDRVILPSFYDLNMNVEFSTTMNEIYTGNLFNKEAGFTDHKMKRIVSKMTEAEENFRKIRMTDWSNGKVNNIYDFLKSEDTFHTFDKNFIVTATKDFFEKKVNGIALNDAILTAMTETINDSMMMTSSLVAGPMRSECIEFNTKIERTKTFLSLFNAVKELSTHTLLGMVSRKEIVDAIFTIFPKNQIGGPREILIQAVMLRYHVKLLERISLEICRTHEKEMLTKDRKKAEIQSEKMSEFKDQMTMLRNKGISSLYFSFNADASRWSPGFVSEQFLYFVANWNIDESIKEFMLNVISSFSRKRILVPENLKRKWMNKPKNEMEFDHYIQKFREMSEEEDGIVTLFSGTGQGMFHFLSSIYHCVMDDFVDSMTNELLKNLYSTSVTSKTLISSDDKTKMSLMAFYQMGHVKDSLDTYIITIDLTYRLANIHMNWKKSALHFLITEFNSLFSIGKRMMWATIKDIYNANSIPDLSCPEDAVNFMLTNIRRCMEHGVYLPTLKVLMMLANNQLRRYYKYDNEIVNELMRIFRCDFKHLPFQLGFVPTTMVLETLLYGSEIHMFKENTSVELKKFYFNLYSCNKSSHDILLKKEVPFKEENVGKYWFELPMRLDKRLIEMKDKFFNNRLMMSPKEALRHINKDSLNQKMNIQNLDHFDKFTMEFFIGMNKNYEFQETMVVHSLIRALQMSAGEGVMMPINHEMEKLKEMLVEVNNRKVKNHWEVEREEEIKVMMEEEKMDIVKFSKRILNMKSKNSSLGLLMGLSKVVLNHTNMKKTMEGFNKIIKNTHPMMRTIRFYTNEVGVNASSKEILEFIMEPNKAPSARVARACTSLFECTDMKLDINKLMTNPFKYIEMLMNSENYSFKEFKDFMAYYNKTMRFVKVTMISDTFCAGNMTENIMNWYRTRSHPAYVLESRENIEYGTLETNFLTEVSMLGPEANLLKYNVDMYNVLMSDSKVMTSLKLLKHSVWTKTNHVNFEKIDFSYHKKKKIKMWCDFKILAIALEIENKELYFLYSNDEFVDETLSSQLLNLIKREMFDAKEKGLEVEFKTKGTRLRGLDAEVETVELEFMASLRMKNLTWTVSLAYRVNMADSKSLSMYHSHFYYTDKYTVDREALKRIEVSEEMTLMDLISESPSIIELDNMFQNKNWLSTKIITRDNRRLEGEDENFEATFEDYESLRRYNESFGNMELQGNIMSMLTNFNPEVSNESRFCPEVNPTALKLALAIMTAMDIKDKEEPELDTPLQERTSIIKIMDMVITNSLRQELVIDKQTMRTMYNSSKRDGITRVFHNILINQIRFHYQMTYQHTLSDGMLLAIYNIILKKMSNIMEMNQSTELKLYDKNFTKETMMMKELISDDVMNNLFADFYD